MAHCYEDCDKPAGYKGVSAWTVDSYLADVPTCSFHTTCPVCNEIMDVSPITLHVECFLHGSPDKTRTFDRKDN